MDRREFLKLSAMTSLGFLVPGTRGFAFSNGVDDPWSKKLIVVLLRGGMDGLNVVAPYGDRRYYDLRPNIALQKSEVLDLDGHFGIHPSLQPLLPIFQNKNLAFVHASGSPDATRSHFDAQDYMESGTPGNKSASSGWMNRLITELPKKEGSAVQAVSYGPVLPRIFSGPATVATIANASGVRKSVLDRPAIANVFDDLYNDPNDELSKVYAEGMAAHKEINMAISTPDQTMDREQQIANKGAPLPGNNAQFGKQVAALFRKEPSLQVAFMDFGGWDTHVNEGTGKGQLANHLTPLASGLADMVAGLGPMFKDTCIVVMSEFGRTAKENGNRGTDHGHGNVMWVIGGDVPGGRVYGRWGGLGQNELHEARDLPTSTDFRSVLSAVLHNHLGVPGQTLSRIFPAFQDNQDPFVQA
jgi:uncharacterized protein (DUF1501 family)